MAPMRSIVRLIGSKRAALDAVRSDIQSGIEDHDDGDTSVDREEAAILRALLNVVDDPEITGAVEERIRGCEEAATATLAIGKVFAQQFRGMESEYLRARAEDIEHLTRQVAAHLLGIRLNNSRLPAGPVNRRSEQPEYFGLSPVSIP